MPAPKIIPSEVIHPHGRSNPPAPHRLPDEASLAAWRDQQRRALAIEMYLAVARLG